MLLPRLSKSCRNRLITIRFSFPSSSDNAINYRSMKTLDCTLFLVIACSLLAVPVAAQDLVINNVRIIVGNAQVGGQATTLIRGGRIVSAAAAAAAAPGVRAI